MFSKSVLLIVASVVLAIYFLPLEKDEIPNVNLNTTYDYIIVGAGSAGAVVANRLSEDPAVSVLLIEAGGSEYDSDIIKVPFMTPALQKSMHDWQFYTVPQRHSLFMKQDRKCYWPRGRVLGGSSSINFMVYVRGSRHDFDQWEAEGCTGWNYKDVLPYFLKMENMQISKYSKSDYHFKGGYLGITEPKYSPLADIVAKASTEIGLKTVDVNGEEQLGFSYMQSTIKDGERQSTATAYIRPVLGRPNLHISINTMVTKVIFDGRKAVGVEAITDNRKQKLLASKEVILSAGSINTPAILMRSGIGPKKHLESLKIPVVADLPVGENLEDHYYVFFKTKLEKPLSFTIESGTSWWNKLKYSVLRSGTLASSATEGNIFAQKPNRDKTLPPYPDVQLQFLFISQDSDFLGVFQQNYNESVDEMIKSRSSAMEFSTAMYELHPKCSGSVRLKSSDPFDPPVIDPNYLCHPDDFKGMLAGVRLMQKLLKTKSLQKIGAKLLRQDFKGVCDQQTFDSDEYWECIIRHWGSTGYHPTSTCRMGAPNDPTAVVDPELRVKGVSGLRVADASVMRHVTSGNTNAPSIMIGEKAADHIKAQDTVQNYREQIKHLKL